MTELPGVRGTPSADDRSGLADSDRVSGESLTAALEAVYPITVTMERYGCD